MKSKLNDTHKQKRSFYVRLFQEIIEYFNSIFSPGVNKLKLKKRIRKILKLNGKNAKGEL